jgi:hypothetical protein
MNRTYLSSVERSERNVSIDKPAQRTINVTQYGMGCVQQLLNELSPAADTAALWVLHTYLLSFRPGLWRRVKTRSLRAIRRPHGAGRAVMARTEQPKLA